jgi:diguanylate cyclase
VTERERTTSTLDRSLIALVIASFCFYCLVRALEGNDLESTAGKWLYGLAQVGIVAWCGRAARHSIGPRRRAALLMTFALASSAAGDLIWNARYASMRQDPRPSWADVAWLGYYVPALAAVITYMRATRARASATLWADGLIAGCGTAALAALAFDVITHDPASDTVGIAVQMAYPTLDMLVVGVVICSVALSAWRATPAWIAVAGGLVAFAVADTISLYTTARSGSAPALLAVAWPMGALLITAGCWTMSQAPPGGDAPRSVHGDSAVAVPASAAAASLAMLVVGQFVRLPHAAVTLATASVLAGIVRLLITFQDLRSLASSRVEARTDDLTELGNRRFFYERAAIVFDGRALTRAAALLVVDLDHFKEINDTLGHHLGDELLRQVGPRLRLTIRDGDVIARLGGDEFVIILDGAGEQAAVAVATRARDALLEPFVLDGITVRIDASVGVAMFPQHGRDASALLQRADVAMYQAKTAGGGHEIYVAERDPHSRQRLQNIDELRRGIAEGRMVVHYQPKIAAHTEQVCGAEALVRWDHPERGLIYPVDFLPLAEECGLMRELTSAVLERALLDCVSWLEGGARLAVAVNLSVTNLVDVDFAAMVEQSLSRHDLDPRLLMFEITENLILADPERAKATLVALRTLGVRISLDDYGTGYSSLAYLRQLPLDELKLDRSFVAALDHDPTAWTFVATARQLANALGLQLVAEGVESARTWKTVVGAGCDIGQGYYFARPLDSRSLLHHVLNGEPGRTPAEDRAGAP